MLVNLRVSANIEFTSTSHRDESCHLILMTLANNKGDIVVSATNNCWLFARCIKPRDTSDIVLPDNTNPYMYRLDVTFPVDFCLLVGCPYYVRIVVIPCCRTDININSLSFSNDTSNPKYLVAGIPPGAICSISNIVNNGYDGYYAIDVPLKDSQYYRCKRYIINQKCQTRLRNILGSLGAPFCNGLNYIPCPLNKGATTNLVTNQFYISTSLPNHVLDYNLLGVVKDTYFCFSGLFASDYLTEVNDISCCGNCYSYSVSYENGNSFMVNLLVIYQDCNDGMLKTQIINIPAGSQDMINITCAVEGSVFGLVYDNASFVTNANISLGSACNNCGNFMNQ